MKTLPTKVSLLFETSWEVCNKIGGIYTVLSTKARVLQNRFGDNLCFIGPDVWGEDRPSPDFIEEETPLTALLEGLTLPEGVTVRCGRWIVPGKPQALLVGFKGVYPMLNEEYGRMWQHFGVDSLHSYGDYSEGCAFAIAAAIVIEAIVKTNGVDTEGVVAHFNEWTTGMGLLRLRLDLPGAATVFTTHATSIGRSICSNGKPLYDYFEGYNGDQMARELNMEAKHSLEKAAAHAADCFTTVSHVTARECKQLLDIEPAVVTPNGFEPEIVPKASRLTTLRKKGRQRLLLMARSLTGKQMNDNTFIVATSGRGEFRNKGLDLFIDSVSRAAREAHRRGRSLLALVLVPGWKGDVQEGLTDNMAWDRADRLEHPFVTHRLNNEEADPIFRRLRELTDELPESAAIIYVPSYLDGSDRVLDISYYDLLPALDMTVFPSYYEPWGYTPLESMAFGVPTLTTDKAGFGQWLLRNTGDSFNTDGAEVIERTDSNYLEASDVISQDITRLAMMDVRILGRCRSAAKRTAALADWSIFIDKYIEAFGVAERRRDERLQK